MKYFERIEIENDIITSHIIGEKPKKEKEGVTYLYASNIQATVGDDVRIYSDLQAGVKKPLSKLVEECLVTVPNGKKLNAAGTDFVDMTEAEKVAAGLITLQPDEKIQDGYITKKSEQERYEAGLMTKEAYNAYIDTKRQETYTHEADPLGMQVLRGDIEKTVWLEKIEEIKKRYPKAE